jgi:3-hydroxy acid dehydrogenase / malonic semialdehyde reductase
MITTGHALVTGGAGGIGKAIVTALVATGHRVVVADQDGAAAAALAVELGPSAFALPLDVTDSAAVDTLLDRLPEAFRPIDLLVNNAGHDVGGRTRFDLGRADDWSSIIDVNLTGMMRVTRALLPDMVARDTGDVVIMGSISALRQVPDTAPYTASKAGVHAFADILRADLAETGIRVTEILPGLTKTNIVLKRHRGDAAAAQRYIDGFRTTLDPEDVARSVLYALDQPRHMQVAQMFLLPTYRW